jgi:hypothetical protein
MPTLLTGIQRDTALVAARSVVHADSPSHRSNGLIDTCLTGIARRLARQDREPLAKPYGEGRR